jgi:hypothetical protein
LKAGTKASEFAGTRMRRFLASCRRRATFFDLVNGHAFFNFTFDLPLYLLGAGRSLGLSFHRLPAYEFQIGPERRSGSGVKQSMNVLVTGASAPLWQSPHRKDRSGV